MVTQKQRVLEFFLSNKGKMIDVKSFRLEMLKQFILQPLEHISQLR